jgi:hypothetical protein
MPLPCLCPPPLWSGGLQRRGGNDNNGINLRGNGNDISTISLTIGRREKLEAAGYHHGGGGGVCWWCRHMIVVVVVGSVGIGVGVGVGDVAQHALSVKG